MKLTTHGFAALGEHHVTAVAEFGLVILEYDDDLSIYDWKDALALGKALVAAGIAARATAAPKTRKRMVKRKRAIAKQATVSHLRVVK